MRRLHRKPEVYSNPHTGTEPVKSGATPLKPALQHRPDSQLAPTYYYGFLPGWGQSQQDKEERDLRRIALPPDLVLGVAFRIPLQTQAMSDARGAKQRRTLCRMASTSYCSSSREASKGSFAVLWLRVRLGMGGRPPATAPDLRLRPLAVWPCFHSVRRRERWGYESPRQRTTIGHAGVSASV